jgi:hypothetical protein
MADGIFEDYSVYLVEVTFWCGGRRAALKDKGQSSFSEFSPIANKPTGRCSPYEWTASILD